MQENFMKERKVLPLLLSMSLPMVISMLVNSLYNIVDSFFVAQISEDAMTALSLVYPVQNFINAVAIGFGVGMNAVIAYHLGAGEPDKADAAASKGMALAFVHTVVLTVASIAAIPAFLRMFTSDQTVIDLGVRYGRIAFAFTFAIVIGLAFEKIYQAVGRMKVTMASLLAGCAANIILDPLLIFGIGPFPELGIAGAALATGLGQVLTLVIYLVLYRLQPMGVRVRRQVMMPDRRMAARLYVIGIPAILNLALPSLLISALNGILSVYGQIYVVILGIYYKLQTFIYLPASGIVQGMRPIIGYNAGAGEHRRVRQIYVSALVCNAIIMACGTAICLAVPGQLMALFAENGQTVAAGQAALRIISAGFLISAVSVTSCGALEGLGKGMPSLVISLLRYLVVIVPAAFVLSRLWGATGVWNAFWITEAVTAVCAFFIYRRAARGGQAP